MFRKCEVAKMDRVHATNELSFRVGFTGHSGHLTVEPLPPVERPNQLHSLPDFILVSILFLLLMASIILFRFPSVFEARVCELGFHLKYFYFLHNLVLIAVSFCCSVCVRVGSKCFFVIICSLLLFVCLNFLEAEFVNWANICSSLKHYCINFSYLWTAASISQGNT